MTDLMTPDTDTLSWLDSDEPVGVTADDGFPDEAWVVQIARTLGFSSWPRDLRHVGDEDIAKTAFDLATDWAQRYSGTDQFLLKMKTVATNRLFSDGQAAAVLDNMVRAYREREVAIARTNDRIAKEADFRVNGNWELEIAQAAEYERWVRDQERRKVAAEAARYRQEKQILKNERYRTDMRLAFRTRDEEVIPVPTGVDLSRVVTGTYTLVQDDGSHLTIRIRVPRLKADRDGRRFVSYLSGPNNEADYTTFATIGDDGSVGIWSAYAGNDRFRAALRFLATMDDDTARTGMFRYAMESGNCAICGRTLTHPESLATGIGPECIKNVGWAA